MYYRGAILYILCYNIPHLTPIRISHTPLRGCHRKLVTILVNIQQIRFPVRRLGFRCGVKEALCRDADRKDSEGCVNLSVGSPYLLVKLVDDVGAVDNLTPANWIYIGFRIPFVLVSSCSSIVLPANRDIVLYESIEYFTDIPFRN